MKFILLYRRRWALFYLPIVALALAAMWLAVRLMPIPPSVLVMSVGTSDGGGNGSYLIERYRDALERQGIRLDLRAATSTQQALALLRNFDGPEQAGFANGMLSGMASPDLQALAIVGKQPVWIFSRIPNMANLSQLRGLRIASRGPGTAAYAVTLLLLAQAQLQPKDATLESLEPSAGVKALQEGRIDVLVMVDTSEAQAVRELTRASGIWLVGVSQANSLVAREPRLQAFILPEGSIELRGDIPPKDLSMLAVMTNLLVRKNLHPAMQRALLDAAQEIHEPAGFLQRHGDYPRLRNTDFPLSPVARAMALGERPWLERLLPYRTAQWTELLLYALLPILLITTAVLVWIPRLFAWRINAVLQNYYGELKFLEAEIRPSAADRPLELRHLLSRLDAIEHRVATLDLPNQYADRWYTLREHLAKARESLFELRGR